MEKERLTAQGSSSPRNQKMKCLKKKNSFHQMKHPRMKVLDQKMNRSRRLADLTLR